MRTLFFVLIIIIATMKTAYADFDLDNAKTSRKEALQSRIDVKIFERDRAWEDICGSISSSVQEGLMSVTVFYDRVKYPSFEPKLKAKGYTIEDVDLVNKKVKISW